MLGWVAPVNATESPSQLRPALIHRTWIRVSSAFIGSFGWHACGFPGPGWGPCGAGVALRPTCASLVLRSTPAKVCCQSHLSQRSCETPHCARASTHRYQTLHSVSLGSRDGYDFDFGIDRTSMLRTEISNVEIDVRQQVDLVNEHQPRRREHVRVLQRLVGSLRSQR